jgi:hypothetical protein
MSQFATEASEAISTREWADWDQHGFFIRREFAPEVCAGMLDRAIAIARAAAAGEPVAPALVVEEARTNPAARSPEELVSKIFRLHRDSVFAEFAHDPRVVDIVASVLGLELDVFLMSATRSTARSRWSR